MGELRALSPGADPTVTGVVMSWSGEEIMLRIPDRRGPTMVAGEAIGQDVRIPTGAIAQLELRRVDRLRTALATGIGVAAIGAAVVAIVSDAFGGDELADPGPDVQARIPLFPFGALKRRLAQPRPSGDNTTAVP
jgi:hypothetical protein